MKNKLSKKRMPLIALLTTVLMFFCFVPVLSAASVAYGDSEEDTWTYQDCLQMRSYLYNNFETFVDEYNKTVDEGNALKASSIEYSSIINLIEDENYGVYFDFDGDNGYAVITGGYTIYELTVAGDYKCLRNSNKLYYSYLDGFVELDENGVYQRVFQNEEKPIGGSVYYGMPESDSGSSGDTEWKDGEIKIDEIDDYIKTHYPSYKFITKNESL